MRRISTIFLRTAAVAMSLGVLAICTLLLPRLWGDIDTEFPDYSYAVYAVFVALYVAALPFFVGVHSAWRLLSLIDKSAAFTVQAVKAMRIISVCAGIISLVYVVSLLFFYIWADNDDAPGLMVVGIVLASVPMLVSVFAALLTRLLGEATTIKTENELTV